MGAGIAYEFKIRFPNMFEKYKYLCDKGQIDIGKLWLYKLKDEDKYNENFEYILNFPTKKHWRYPTKVEYLEKGLKKFVITYREKGIKSVAFPLLGASKGGLKEERVIKIMENYLEDIDIPVEIWHFNPDVEDDIYQEFKDKFLNSNIDLIKKQSKLTTNSINKIKSALKKNDIKNFNGLFKKKGIGDIL